LKRSVRGIIKFKQNLGHFHTIESIMFENIREFGRYVMENNNHLEFTIPSIAIKRNDNFQIMERIMSIDPEKRKELKINKSTLWYQQKKIKEGKSIKVYNKLGVRLNGFNKI